MNFKNNIASVFSMKHFLILSIFALPFSACDDLVLPEEGSIADLTPPSANFSTMATVGEYKEINFTNLSISATDYVWNFGDGNTSTEVHPAHEYEASGFYMVSLTGMVCTDTSVFTHTVCAGIDSQPQPAFSQVATSTIVPFSNLTQFVGTLPDSPLQAA